jgi:membrane protease YdiL (CAAX protease family)
VTSVPPPPTAPPPQRPERPESTAVVPADGPGWRWWMAPAALAIGLVAPISVVIVLAIAGVSVDSGSDDGPAAIILTAAQDLAFIGAALFMARQAGRIRLGDFGLRPTRFWRALGWAAVAAVAYLVFASIWNALVAGGQHQDDVFKELGVHRGSTLGIGVLALLICVLAPIAEEFLFRGFCFEALRPSLGVGGAALAVGAVFGAVHVTSTPAVLLVELAFLGFVLCLLRWKTGSLYPCIGLHAVNNSVSYGALLGWGWQIVPLTLGSLALLVLVLRPIGARASALATG